MRITIFNKLFTGLSLVLLTAAANATPIQGTSLQSGLNSITQGGAFYDVNTNQYQPDEVWELTAFGGSFSTLLFEISAFANSSTFGIYDINDPNNKLQLFDGAASTGDQRLLYLDSGNVFNVLSFIDGPLGSATFSSTLFGYYIDSSNGGTNTAGGVFYSQSSLNTNLGGGNGGSTDHMVAFRGNDVLQVDTDGPGGNGYGLFHSGEFILAFEDLNYNTANSSDFDFSDMVIMVESVLPVPVPEPAPLTLLGFGLLGLGILGARRKKAVAA